MQFVSGVGKAGPDVAHVVQHAYLVVGAEQQLGSIAGWRSMRIPLHLTGDGRRHTMSRVQLQHPCGELLILLAADRRQVSCLVHGLFCPGPGAVVPIDEKIR